MQISFVFSWQNLICGTIGYGYILSEKILVSDPEFQQIQDSKRFGTKSEYYGKSVLKSAKIFRLRRQHQWTDEEFEVALR